MLVHVASLAFGIQGIGFVLAIPNRTEKYFDLIGSMTFGICALYSLFSGNSWNSRQIIGTGMVCVWCLRLGTFLFSRVLKEGKDSRFDKIKKSLVRFGTVWFLQGVWVFVTAYPVYMINSKDGSDLLPLDSRDLVGVGLWLFGFLFEGIS
jgi:steroid 5-alpha reductase family enzyme